MLTPTQEMLQRARTGNYAVGAFNIYNLEGATAVVRAAERLSSPVMLQMLPSALELGGNPLVAMCLALANEARVEVAVHLDHCTRAEMLQLAVEAGCSSVMADGSALSYQENIRFTQDIVQYAAERGCGVEAELGKLTGEEDGMVVEARDACLTSPGEAADFVENTGVAALAVCIGNVHGAYRRPPELDFDRLAEIAKVVTIPLVLHGTSGLPDEMVKRSMEYGVCKFNVNTEVRKAYIEALEKRFSIGGRVELVELMELGIAAMHHAVLEKIRLFGSVGKSQVTNE